MKNKGNWDVRASRFARTSINPIRQIVEKLKPKLTKSLIPLSVGDPTVFGNLGPCEEINQALLDSVNSNQFNGYLPSNGLLAAREAIAKYCSSENNQIHSDHVFITSGCSYAIELCIELLVEPGQNILLPRPGFPLYLMMAETHGIHVKFYDLLPEKEFEIDLEQLESCIDKDTAAIVYNNPSNPCGSVYTEEHMRKFLDIAERHCIPIIADEIYDHMVFIGKKFIPLAELSENVPILSCRGTTKRFLIPGHRLSWILFQDRQNRFGEEVLNGLQNLCQRLLGANSILQGALPSILTKTPASFFESTRIHLMQNATVAYERLSRIPGLKPIMPSGAMYMMVSISLDNFPGCLSDVEFIEKLLNEQAVLCLPGKCFNIEKMMRIVLTAPIEMIQEAMDRIELFCRDHFKPSSDRTSIKLQNKENTIIKTNPVKILANVSDTVALLNPIRD